MLGPVAWSARRRLGTFAVLTVLLVALALVVNSRRRAERVGHKRATAMVPRLGPAAITIVPGVHMLGGLMPSAAYAVETSAGLVLVDSGLDRDAGRLRRQLEELGLDWRTIRAIFLTHAHGDHCGGAQYLRSTTGAKVYAGRGDAPVLRAGEPRVAFFSTFYMPNEAPHPTVVDVELAGDEEISIGGVRFRALAAPGHTPGSMCYLVERHGLRVLFAGDVVMMLAGDEAPRSELRKPLGTYSAYLAPRYRGDARAFLATLQKLRKLPVPDFVLPGHPCADRTPQTPCLSPKRWEALLDTGIHDMETLTARYAADGANFLDGDSKRLLPDLYYLGDFQGTAIYAFVAGARLFVVDAPGGPGLAAFLSERLRQLGVERAPSAVLLTSCGARETAGLDDLLAQHHCEVIAPREGILAIKDRCAPETVVVAADELPEKGWFPVAVTPLRGRGAAAVAYRFQWSGKTVLFSGRIPVKMNHEAGVSLVTDLATSPENPDRYMASLDQLREQKPDVWLPAVPSDCQNANLYESYWDKTLWDNRTIVERYRATLVKP
jgi:glyoxylase-like metal-dependent hydrolase (beta-lactamase superfamily II)